MTGNFEKTSVDWQLHLLRMQFSEWWESLFRPVADAELPDWSLPEWMLMSLFWAIVLTISAWALWQLYKLFSPYFAQELFPKREQSTSPHPPESSLSEAQWRERSRSLAQQGNYREACRALYQAVLQKLDTAALIPAQLSRTDGEYLNEVQILPNPRPYQALIQIHEQLYFSDTPITQEIFDHCEQAYRETEPG